MCFPLHRKKREDVSLCSTGQGWDGSSSLRKAGYDISSYLDPSSKESPAFFLVDKREFFYQTAHIG